MSTCTIIIKIKDYFPKVDTIPYQNFICLFTCGENEGQLPLLSQEKDYFQHEITNVISDIKYKVHVLDFNDMSLIGMCEMTIPYKIINQIKPPNGFIQEQQKKILIDVNTKRKLFGTVLNMGDIYINIYSELYLSEKNNKLLVEKTGKSTARKKKVISNKYKKLDGSPKTVKKKKLIMKMNSDRQALMNLNKNNINSCVIKNNNNFIPRNDKINSIIKQNNSFNYKDIQLNRNGVLKSNNHNNISFRERITKQKSKDRMNEEKKSKDRNINYKKDNHTKILNRIIKTETNKNYKNEIKKLNKKDKDKDKDNKKIINKKNVYLNNQNENENLTFNNHEGNKITTIESLDDIDISEKQYITKSKTKNDNQNNTVSIISNTLFTTNSIEQELNEIENNIIEKNKQIKNDFGAQLKDNKNNNNPSENGIDNNINQLEIKNNLIKLIDYYALLNHKLLIVHKKNIYINKKCNIYREKLSNELKKNNILIEKKKGLNNNIINENNNSSLNEKFIRQIIKLKKSEFKIYQNIFNLFYYDYDILKWKEEAKNKKMEEGLKIDLLLVVFKNLIKNYGNISQIYLDNMQKKNILKKCLHKFNLNEKEENIDNKIIIDNTYNKKENKDINNNNKNNVNKEEKEKEKSNKNEIEKFRVINEVDEEKEDEIDDEEDKLSKNQNYYNNDDISCPSSNIKENSNFYNSNKKLKSDKKNKSGQKNQLNNENLIKYNNIITNVIKDENKIEMNINKNNLFNDENKDLNNNNINDAKNENENHIDEINKEELKNEKKNVSYENSDIKKEINNKEEEINNYEINNNKQIINEIITNNIDSEKDEIKSLKNENKNKNEMEKYYVLIN